MKLTSVRKFSAVLGFILLACCFVTVNKAAAVAQATYTPVMGNYCVQPPFLTPYVPPQVMFTMSKDHKYYLPAYNDASDLDGDGDIEEAYKHSFDYYGYFDSHKCYDYDTTNNYYKPIGITSDKYCTTGCTNGSGTSVDCSGKTSGNFLNWLAMSRADIVKMVLYGGYRTTNSTNYSHISGEYIPQDAHIWGKEYLGADANKLFYNGVSNKRAIFCVAGSGSTSVIKTIPDVTAVAGVTVTGGLRRWDWININGVANLCQDGSIDKNGDGTIDTLTLTGRYNRTVTVKVCDPADGFNTVGDWEKKHCKNYSTANPKASTGPWRPVGLMQHYGEVPSSTGKVCSMDMATTCTSDTNCTSNGQCVDAANMYFGLIMGTHKNAKNGGMLRKSIFGINEETSQTTGIFNACPTTGGKGCIISSIEQLKAPAVSSIAKYWGNPMAEIMYEGLRYYADKASATSDFSTGITESATGDDSNYIKYGAWDQPYSKYPTCSMRFNLIFSDTYNSFDHDKVPGSAFATFSGDLTDMDVSTLANDIWTNENLGTNVITGEFGVGYTGENNDQACSAKTITGFGNLKGICPSEAGLSGTFYPASVALYGHNSMKTKMNTANALTYVVAFPSNVPSLTFYPETNKPVIVTPYGKSTAKNLQSSPNYFSCTTTNTNFNINTYTNLDLPDVKYLSFVPKNATSNCPNVAMTTFYLEESEYDTSSAIKRLKYAKFLVGADAFGADDYDKDSLVRYTVCAYGATNSNCTGLGLTSGQVHIKSQMVHTAVTTPAAFGFTIENVGSDSKSYLVLEHSGTMNDNPGAPPWTTNQLVTFPYTNAVNMKFNADTVSAVVPKSPLWYAAKYGGFTHLDANLNDLPYTDSTCTTTSPNPKCREWTTGKNGLGVPDTYFEVSNPSQVEQRLRDALEAIMGRVSSGTAASILNNSEGSGASLLQAVFYPKKDFDNNTSVNWIGEMHNMWYYLDPFFNSTSIREDSNKDYKLNLKQDKIAQFYFDSDENINKTQVRLFSDSDGDGNPDSTTVFDTVDPDNVKSLWKAGRKLWARTTPRLIYTHTDITETGFDDATTKLTYFGVKADETSNVAALTANTTFLSLMPTTNVSKTVLINDATRAGKLIAWTHGTDQTADTDGAAYRPRKVTIDACSNSGSGCETSDSIYTREWKLGDIVSATPKLISNNPLNGYGKPFPNGYSDKSYDAFTKTTTYKNRGMVFVGANDGMLHAFRLGVLKENGGKFDKAQFNNSSGALVTSTDDLGKEEWAFIPKQVLPYLTYIKDPDYCHVFTVDKSPSITDVSIGTYTGTGCTGSYWDCIKPTDGSTWKTVLISGMGTGGATKWNGNTAIIAPDVCVKTPVKVPVTSPATTAATATGVGYSSYFALDVTDPTSPKYLWEFPGSTTAAGLLGSSTTGPAIIRIASHADAVVSGVSKRTVDNLKNGRWFAVFASGPTGPIETVKREFKGQSDQQLRIFVVDVADGTLVKTFDTFSDGTALPSEAFAGSLATSWLDTDRANNSSVGWYSDDAVYIGYTKKCTTTSTPADTSCVNGSWTKGGVLRLSTGENTDPTTWKLSKLIDGIGPVTTSVTKLQDRKNNNLWIYFGTGRYFFKSDDVTSNKQTLYGVKDPCYASATIPANSDDLEIRKDSINPNCTTAVSGTLVDQSAAPSATISTTDSGWKLDLDAPASGFASERLITDPVASTAGAIFFTTFKPSNDVCKFGGDSLIWALRYDTGGVPPSAAMQGKALMQVSTGAFAEISLATAFSNPGDTRLDGRRIATPITGVPPTAQGLSLIVNPSPVKKILHVREK